MKIGCLKQHTARLQGCEASFGADTLQIEARAEDKHDGDAVLGGAAPLTPTLLHTARPEGSTRVSYLGFGVQQTRHMLHSTLFSSPL